MIDNTGLHVNTITLLAACECNLNCQYCSIAASKNSHSAELHRKNVQALKDGTYLENLKKTLARLGQSQNQIDGFQIWGQEPTLIIGYLADNWRDWKAEFPNVTHMMYSTNGMDKVDDVLRFVKIFDECSTKESALTLQISYDGDYGEEEVRGGSCQKIIDNYVWLARQLNNVKLKNTKVTFQGHGVFSFELMRTLKTFEDLSSYVDSIDYFINEMDNACINKNVEFLNASLQWQTGNKSTTYDGIAFRDCLYKMDLLEERKISEYFKRSPGSVVQIFGGSWRSFVDLFHGTKFRNLADFCDWVINDDTGMIYIAKALHCSTTVQDLKIMYDGTVLLCQNDIFNRDYDKDKEVFTVEEQAHRFHMDHNQHVNFLTASDEEINNYLSYILRGRFDGTRCLYHSLCNMMLMLAQCGQISKSYLDLNKIKVHSMMALFMDSCYHNSISETGSIFLRSTSTTRLLCNGILDDLENWFNTCALSDHLHKLDTNTSNCGCEKQPEFQQNCTDKLK